MLLKVLGYLSGDISNKAIAFLSLPYLLNHLSVENYALFAITFITFQLSITVINSGTTAKIIMDVSSGRGDEDEVITAAILIQTVNFIVALALAGALSLAFPDLAYIRDIYLIVFCAYVNAMILITNSYYQSQQQIMYYAVSQIITTSIIFGVLISVIAKGDFESYWLVLSAFMLVLVTVHLAVLKKKGLLTLQLSRSLLKESVAFSCHQLPHVLTNAVRTCYDRFFIAAFLPPLAVAIYSAYIQVASIFSATVLSVSKYITPKLFSVLDGSIGQAKNLIRHYQIGVLFLFVLVVAFGLLFATYTFPAEYQKDLHLLPILCGGITFQGLYLSRVSLIHFYGASKYLSYASLCSLLVNLTLTPVLFHGFGVTGVAFAAMSSWITLFIIIRHYSDKVVSNYGRKNIGVD